MEDDDPTIADDARLWRRVPQWQFFFDEKRGRWRPKSSAFDDDPATDEYADGSPMSVFIADGLSGPDEIMAGHEGFALAELRAGLARSRGQRLVRTPPPQGHVHVVGHKIESTRRAFALAADWVIPPLTA